MGWKTQQDKDVSSPQTDIQYNFCQDQTMGFGSHRQVHSDTYMHEHETI